MAASNLCLLRQRERQSQPSSHRKSIAATVCSSARLSVSWIAYSLFLMPLLGCCAIGENMTTLHGSSVMFYTGSQFLFASSLRSVCLCTSRFTGLRLGTCASFGDAFIRFGVKTSIDGQMRSSRKTDEDSVWRPRLLSCWPQMLEQTSCCSAYSRLD